MNQETGIEESTDVLAASNIQPLNFGTLGPLNADELWKEI